MLIYILLLISTIAIAALLIRTIWALNRFEYRPIGYEPTELPGVSVCIAVRNETHALAYCLEHVIKSTYPKLEILVLDDSSTDDTSLIIKSFAHAGVRFIAGQPLPQGWLGKNHAYQSLINEASGDYVLFLDVDTIIRPDTIDQLVTQLLAHDKSMLSVLPRREDSGRVSAVFGTMRYYWELLLARKAAPPAASALWMVRRSRLAEGGIGLENYGMSVRPERHLARQLQRKKEYYYLIGSEELGVSYEKRLGSQYETAFRLYYPMTGRSIIKWFAASLFMAMLVAPLILLILASTMLESVWSSLLVVLIATTFGLFVHRTYARPAWLIRVALGPVLAVQEFILLLMSYVMYLTGSVTWKGRPVATKSGKNDAISLDESRR